MTRDLTGALLPDLLQWLNAPMPSQRLDFLFFGARAASLLTEQFGAPESTPGR